MKKQRLVVIVGPTAVGKTKVSLKLAEEIGGEIIIADSRQVYRFLNIGTAKPTKEEQKKVKHHLLDILDPDEDFSVADYKRLALKAIKKIINKDKIPIMVGGTGLYIKAVIDDFSLGEVGADKNLRKRLEKEAEEKGLKYLYQMLKKVDEESAKKITSFDKKRIIRALEVFYLTGVPLSEKQKKKEGGFGFKLDEIPALGGSTPLFIGLTAERAWLYKQIDFRVDRMIEEGLIEEVQHILARGYNKDLNSLNTIGYKQIIEHLQGRYSKEEAIRLIKRDTRHYAKRQWTWFKKDNRINWIDVTNKSPDQVFKICRDFYFYGE